MLGKQGGLPGLQHAEDQKTNAFHRVFLVSGHSTDDNLSSYLGFFKTIQRQVSPMRHDISPLLN